jgi:phosphate uptake regulator
VEPCLKKVALNKVIVAFEKSDKAKSRSFEIDYVVLERFHLFLRRNILGGCWRRPEAAETIIKGGSSELDNIERSKRPNQVSMIMK